MKRTVAAFGRIDILMNNAGVTRKLDFFEVKESDWDWIHSVNAKGAFFCMQAAAREMAGRREGKIINVASIAGKGFRGTSNVAYAGSKGAVIAMTRVAASQLAPHNINVNAICPGVTRTALYERIVEGVAEREKISVAEASAKDGRLHPAQAVEHAGRHRAHGRLPGLRGGQEHHRSVVQRRRRDHVGLAPFSENPLSPPRRLAG